jgi:His-Xaa-Ser system radical SAM maturase HxsC
VKLHASGTPRGLAAAVIGRLTSQPINDRNARRDHVAFCKDGTFAAFQDFEGYAAFFSPSLTPPDLGQYTGRSGCVYGTPGLEYLGDGDIVSLAPSGAVSVLYRKQSHYNTLLATERCNSLCLMCSQPPKVIDDSYRTANILRVLELVDLDCQELIVSGGEPTLLGDDFFKIIEKAKCLLPHTALHVLTNGRLFKDRQLAARLGSLDHPDIMLGIPLYSDIDDEHDYVVQASGAFSETVHGLYNLAEAGVPVEIRVVIHALTYRRLPQLAEYIYRNMPFAAHVALMGMEMFGYVHQNFEQLWIDPLDYQQQLSRASVDLAMRGMRVSIYNHQLCTIPRDVWPFARKSISDWKNLYLTACEGCDVKNLCAGFFQSAVKRHSAHIKAIRLANVTAGAHRDVSEHGLL